MAEENKDLDQEEKEESTESDTSAEDVKNESDEVDTDNQNKEGDEKTVPYTRFKEVNDKYKAIKIQLDELKNNQSNSDGNNSDETENNELESYKTAFNEVFQSKLKLVPEEFVDLIPEGDDLSKFKWIESAIAKGLFDSKIKSFGNQGNNPLPSEPMTKKEFMKLSYTDRVKLKNENEDLYNKLIKQ